MTDNKVEETSVSEDKELQDFFSDNNTTLKSGLPEKEPVKTEQAEGEDVEALKKRLTNLQNQYEASSKEGKRLAAKLKEIEPLMPLINEMNNNEDVFNAVKNTLQGKPTTQGDSQGLELPDDFVLDTDEALRNPNSDSAKFLRAFIRNEAKTVAQSETNKIQESLSNRDRRSEIDRQKAELMETYGLDEDGFNEFMAKVKSQKISLEDMYNLMQLKENGFNMSKSMTEEEVLQRLQNSRRKKTLANKETDNSSIDPLDEIMDAVIGGPQGDGGLGDFFRS